jgi:hypothetical protein
VGCLHVTCCCLALATAGLQPAVCAARHLLLPHAHVPLLQLPHPPHLWLLAQAQPLLL